jgi:hypothetical protein
MSWDRQKPGNSTQSGKGGALLGFGYGLFVLDIKIRSMSRSRWSMPPQRVVRRRLTPEQKEKEAISRIPDVELIYDAFEKGPVQRSSF